MASEIPTGFWQDQSKCRYVGNFGVTEVSPQTLEAYGLTWPPTKAQAEQLERLTRILPALQEHKWITDLKEPWLASV